MSALWAFLKSPLGRWLAGMAILLLLAFAVYRSGVSAGAAHEKAEYAKLVAVANARAAKVVKASTTISEIARRDHAADLIRIADLTTKLQQKAPTYVTHEADRRCVVSRGYVELRNAAGAGVAPVPAAPGGSVDADSGLVLSDLAANDITNAAAFRTAVAEVTAWRGWYAAQAELWTKNTTRVEATQ